MYRACVLIAALFLTAQPSAARETLIAELVFQSGSDQLAPAEPAALRDAQILLGALSSMEQVAFVLEGRRELLDARRQAALSLLGLQSADNRVALRPIPHGASDQVAVLVSWPFQPKLNCPWRMVLTAPGGRTLQVPAADQQTLLISDALDLRFEPARAVPYHSVEARPRHATDFAPYDPGRPEAGDVRLRVSATPLPATRDVGDAAVSTQPSRAFICTVFLRSASAS